jgi:uncharacterized protein (DUF2236 family)
VLPVIRLPKPFETALAEVVAGLMNPPGQGVVNFLRPGGEPALLAADSLSWRVFKNPISLFIGGVAAVILELAEPAVRTAIWKQSAFRMDPIARIHRTGRAAMITVYGARSVAEPMIASVTRMHAGIRGRTPAGTPFSARDVDLLTWVHGTASFAFSASYARFVAPLEQEALDRFFEEGYPVAQLYGALDAPRSQGDMMRLMETMRPRLESSPAIVEFMHIIRRAPALLGLRWLQPSLVRAAVDIIPPDLRERLGLTARDGLRLRDRYLVRAACALADRLVLPASPAAQACARLGLPARHLYR